MPAKYFTLYSSKESSTERKISVLALVETLLATGLYVWLTWYFETYAFLVSAILIAPLALVRSDASVALGVKWFQAYFDDDRSRFHWLTGKRVIAVIFGLLICGGVLILATGNEDSVMLWFLLMFLAPNFIGLILVFCIGYQRAVETTAIENEFLVVLIELPFLVVGHFFGVATRALATRVGASVVCLPVSMLEIPQNWMRIVTLVDFGQPPELVPGLSVRRSHLAFKSIFDRLLVKGGYFERFLGTIIVTTFFLPAILYRWSLKATWWFYLPLVFLAGAKVRAADSDWRAKWIATDKKLIEWLGVLLAALSLTAAVISAIDPGRLQALITAAGMGETAISAFSVFYILDWSSLYPWQYLTLPSTLLTIGLFLWIDSLAKDAKHDPTVTDGWQLKTASFLRRLRDLLVIAWLAIALFYTLTFLHAQCDIPVWLNWIGTALDNYQTINCIGTDSKPG